MGRFQRGLILAPNGASTDAQKPRDAIESTGEAKNKPAEAGLL